MSLFSTSTTSVAGVEVPVRYIEHTTQALADRFGELIQPWVEVGQIEPQFDSSGALIADAQTLAADFYDSNSAALLQNLKDLALLTTEGFQGELISIELADHLNLFFRSLGAAGIAVDLNNPAAISLDKGHVLTWAGLHGTTELIQKITVDLQRALASAPHSLQSYTELVYVKTGNELLADTLEELEGALNTTKTVLDDLADLQTLHNKLSVEARQLSDDVKNLTNIDPTDAIEAIDEFTEPLSPTVDSLTQADGERFIALRDSLQAQFDLLNDPVKYPEFFRADGSLDPLSLPGKLQPVLDDINAKFVEAKGPITGSITAYNDTRIPNFENIQNSLNDAMVNGQDIFNFVFGQPSANSLYLLFKTQLEQLRLETTELNSTFGLSLPIVDFLPITDIINTLAAEPAAIPPPSGLDSWEEVGQLVGDFAQFAQDYLNASASAKPGAASRLLSFFATNEAKFDGISTLFESLGVDKLVGDFYFLPPAPPTLDITIDRSEPLPSYETGAFDIFGNPIRATPFNDWDEVEAFIEEWNTRVEANRQGASSISAIQVNNYYNDNFDEFQAIFETFPGTEFDRPVDPTNTTEMDGLADPPGRVAHPSLNLGFLADKMNEWNALIADYDAAKAASDNEALVDSLAFLYQFAIDNQTNLHFVTPPGFTPPTFNPFDVVVQPQEADASLIPDSVFGVTTLDKWILDAYDTIDQTTADAGQIQHNLSTAISSAEGLNDSQKDKVKRFLFVFEEYYKSASALLTRITQLIERIAQGISR